jgi:hypothetical protein
VLQFTFVFSTRKKVFKNFNSIFDVLYSPFYDTFLLKSGWWCCSFKNLQACRYHVLPSVETGCIFSIPFHKIWYKMFCNKHISLFRCAYLKDISVVVFDGYPSPDIFRANFDTSFINYKFEDFGLPIIQSFGIILLNRISC